MAYTTKITGKVLALMTVLLAALSLASPALAQGEEAMVRVAHLSADTAAVDVRVDGRPVEGLDGLAFETVSPYLPFPAGTHEVEIYAAGDDSAPLFGADLALRADAAYTVGVVGLTADGSLAPQVYEDDVTLPEGENTKLRVVHAVPDVAEVDITTSDGTSLFTDLGFPNATDYAEVPSGTYTFDAKPAGEEEVAFQIPDGTFAPGTVYTAFVVGSAATGDLGVLAAGYSRNSAGEQKTALLPVVARPESVPPRDTGDVSGTGGAPPALAVLAIAGAIALCLLPLRLISGRQAGRGTN